MSEQYGQLENGNQFRLKLDSLIDSRLLIQANSGGGKSYAVRKLLELTHGKVQQIVIDPEGEFATLREKFDYVVASAKGGDALAHPKTAKILAERLLQTSVSAIIDIYELKHHERTAFVRLFLDAMVNAPKELWHPCLVVLDEAHVFAPETDKSESHGAVADIATRGRKRGFCLVAATQRISKLSKDVAAELNNKLIGRAALDVDVKRAAAELGISPKDAMTQLRALEAGQFYAFGPATNVSAPTLMKVGEVLTRHPKRGERATATPKPTQAILAVLPQLADLPKEAEQELRTVEELRKELANVRRELTTSKKTAPVAAASPSPKAAEVRKLSLALEAVMKFLAKITVSEALGEKWTDAKLKAALEAAVVKASEIANDHEERRSKAVASLQDQARQLIERVNALLSDKTTELSISIEPPKPFAVKTSAPPARAARPREDRPPAEGVSRPQQKILDAIAWLNDKGIELPHKNMVAAVAGVSPTSGGYFNNLGSMKSAGLIDYPQPGFVTLTTEGGATANQPESGGELHEKWLEIVTEPQAKILRALIEAHPEPMHKDSLAEHIGVSPTSGGFFNNLGSLRTLGAIDYPSKGFAAVTKYVMP